MVELDSGAVSSRKGRAASSRTNGKGGSSLAASRLYLSLFLSPRILYPYACARNAARRRTLIGERGRVPSRFVKNSRRLRARRSCDERAGKIVARLSIFEFRRRRAASSGCWSVHV